MTNTTIPNLKKRVLISIIICTYNRCESLKDILDNLINQEYDTSFDYEIIIVDNNSKDKTNEVVESLMSKFSGKLKYLFESKQGLSYARNRGIIEAKGEIIVFTDDDCLPEKKWLSKIITKFEERTQIDGIIGGYIWENEYRNKNLDDEKVVRWGSGLNMSFKKEIFQDIGLFDINLGSGSIGCSAEDTDFFYRAKKHKKNIVVCKNIVIVHKDRINLDSAFKVKFRDSKGYIIFFLKHLFLYKDLNACKEMYWFISEVLSDFILALKNKDSYTIHLKFIQIKGILTGIIKGIYIWLFFLPIKQLSRTSKTQKECI